MNRGDGETERRRRFASLCESLRPDLLRFAWWLGRDRGLAEDVVSAIDLGYPYAFMHRVQKDW